jgi:hypothetical protein
VPALFSLSQSPTRALRGLFQEHLSSRASSSLRRPRRPTGRSKGTSCCEFSARRGTCSCADRSRRFTRMPGAGMVRGAPALPVLLLALGLAGGSDGRQMKLAELNHCSRSMGANEWWDAVTGADEYGDMVTTFMHKRWGTALQVLVPNPSPCAEMHSTGRDVPSPRATSRSRVVSCSCITARSTATCPFASSRTCRGFLAARRGQRRSCFLGLGRCVCPLRLSFFAHVHSYTSHHMLTRLFAHRRTHMGICVRQYDAGSH